MHRMNNSGINIDNGLLSASTILTREKCNAHIDDKKIIIKYFCFDIATTLLVYSFNDF